MFEKILKANPYHDERGRFSTHDGATFVSIGAKFTKKPRSSSQGIKVSSPASALDHLDKSGVLVDKNGAYQIDGGDLYDTNEPKSLAVIGAAKGYKGKPKKVSRAKMDSLVADGHRELFRGDSKDEYATALKEGDLRYGLGIYGNGIYMAGYSDSGALHGVSRDQALGTAMEYAKGFGKDSPPASRLTRAVLSKSAKVVDHSALLEAKKAEAAKLADHYDNMFAHIKADMGKNGITKLSDPRAEKFYEKHKELAENSRRAVERFNAIFKEDGAYAAAKGYDAIHHKGTEYVVVLNRSKLIVEAE